MRHVALTLLLAVLAGPAIASPGVAEPNLLWSDRPAGSPDAVFAQVELRGARVAATLAAPSSAGGPGLRVYDKADGSLAWAYTTEGFQPQDGLSDRVLGTLDEHLVGIATSNRAVFTVGVDDQAGEPGFRGRIVSIRAFDLDDGERLPGGRAIVIYSTGPLHIQDMVRFGPRLFLTGSLDGRPYVLAAPTRKGIDSWNHYPDSPEGTAGESVDRAAYATKRLYTAGTREPVDPEAPWPLVVRQYHAKKGRLRWEASYGDTGRTLPRAIAVAPLRLAVAGAWQPDEDGPSRWIVHSLSVFSGDLLWTDMPHPHAASAATAVATTADVVYAAGWIERQRRLPLLRAYDTATGKLLWERLGVGVREGAYAAVRWSFRPRAVVVVGSGRKRGEPGLRTLLQGFDPDDGSPLWTRFGAAGEDGGSFLGMDQRAGLVAAGGALTRADGTSQPLLHLYGLPRQH